MKKTPYFLIIKKIWILAWLFAFVLSPLPLLHSESNTRVYLNTANHKVHKTSCPWGKKCTRNCIILLREEAYRQGGVPCKVCGG